MAGFSILEILDLSHSTATIAERWRNARLAVRQQLLAYENEAQFEGVQSFLECVHALAAHGKLRRYAYHVRVGRDRD